MKNKKRVITIIVFILIILGVYFLFKNIEIKKVEDEYQDYIPEQEIIEESNTQTKIILYFENKETGELETETQIVDAKTLLNEPYKEMINLLIKGPQSSNLNKLIPDGTILNDIKVENGCANINFSKEFLNFESDEKKLKIINSIVNTLTNLKEINSITFSINGEKNGAGELVINSIDTDGVKNGFDIELLREIAQNVSIPLIASGGAGNMEHFKDVFQVNGVDAGLAASIFHFKEIEIKNLKKYLHDNNINVRL